VFRAIEKWAPTFLIDEFDSSGEEMREALRQVLNSGFQRTGRVLRCVGDNHDLEAFSTFSPKALAGIGELSDTCQSRAVRLPLARRKRDEPVASFRHFDGTVLRRKCARWARDNFNQLKAARPAMPKELTDRQADGWESLVAIADACGWGPEAREAALLLCQKMIGESLTIGLLEDIRRVFNDLAGEDDRLKTEVLLRELNGMSDRPWATLCGGQPLHAFRLSKMLARYAIAPAVLDFAREDRSHRARGYLLAWFEDAFSRYLP
jgi:putative DNA primase/helicase